MGEIDTRIPKTGFIVAAVIAGVVLALAVLIL
jgi:hypothetical protein